MDQRLYSDLFSSDEKSAAIYTRTRVALIDLPADRRYAYIVHVDQSDLVGYHYLVLHALLARRAYHRVTLSNSYILYGSIFTRFWKLYLSL